MLGIQASEVGGQSGHRLTGNHVRHRLVAATWQAADQAAQLLCSSRQRTPGPHRVDLGQGRSPLSLMLISQGQLA